MKLRTAARSRAVFAALALSSCGYIGIELKDLPPEDGGDARAPQDAAVRDGGDLDARASDARADLDATPSDGASADAASPDSSLRDGSTDAAQADARIDASASDAAVDAGARCDLTGAWAMKLTVPLTWSGGLLQGGTGQGSIWLKFQGTQSGGTWTGTAQPCGLLLPDFALNPALGNETYALRVPDTLFDHSPVYIAALPATLSVSGSSAVGDSFTISNEPFVVGTTLTNPATDAWPADRTQLAAADPDQDGHNGVTIDYLNDATHLYPPLDLAHSQRASDSYLAVRFAFSGNGNLTSCTKLDGQIAFNHFDTHILGCTIAGGTTQCSSTQAQFLDDNRPQYAPNAATHQAIKISASTTCAQIRSTVLP